MNKKIFLLELIAGVLAITLILFFGIKGIAIFALYALSPLMKEKREEGIEEKLLFHKTNSITFAVSFFILFLLFFLQDYQLITNASLFIKDIWFYLFIGFVMFIHGITGLIMLKSKK